MDTIDPKVAGRWTDKMIADLMEEVEEEKTKLSSWVRHYDELNRKYEKLCDALYVIIGLESHELDQGPWTARSVLQDVGEWPR